MAGKTLGDLFGLVTPCVEEVFEVRGEEQDEVREIFGCFRRRNVADAFAAMKKGEGHNAEVVPLVVTTDGVRAYMIGSPVVISDEGEAVEKIRTVALARLSSLERHFLGWE